MIDVYVHERSSLEDVLHRWFGYARFGQVQKEIIMHVLNGRDVLAVIATRGEITLLSNTTLIKEGTSIVISPLCTHEGSGGLPCTSGNPAAFIK
jgi:ATP-dependent DNA helicase RecQ